MAKVEERAIRMKRSMKPTTTKVKANDMTGHGVAITPSHKQQFESFFHVVVLGNGKLLN